MAMLNRVTLAALLLSTALSPLVRSEGVEESTADTSITTQEITTLSMNASLNQNFFTQPLKISDEIRNLAYATLGIGFVKWTNKDVLFCDYNSYENNVKNSKFSKNVDGTLSPVKSEEYTGPANGSASSTKCVRKGKTARSSVELQEGAARILRATTKPEDITQVSLVDLYNNSIPLCVQAKGLVELREFVTYMQTKLAEAAIDPSVRAAELKPLCVVIISGDPLLRTIDNALWDDLNIIYNMTTFFDAPIRKHILSMRSSLCDMVKDAAESGVDINPSFLEGLFDDLNKNNYSFSLKKMAREVLAGIFSIKGVITLAAGVALYRWYMHEAVVEASTSGFAKFMSIFGVNMEERWARQAAEKDIKADKWKKKVAIQRAALEASA